MWNSAQDTDKIDFMDGLERATEDVAGGSVGIDMMDMKNSGKSSGLSKSSRSEEAVSPETQAKYNEMGRLFEHHAELMQILQKEENQHIAALEKQLAANLKSAKNEDAVEFAKAKHERDVADEKLTFANRRAAMETRHLEEMENKWGDIKNLR